MTPTQLQWKYFMWLFLCIALLWAGGLLLLLYSFQEKFIFPAAKRIDRTPATAPFQWEYEDVFLKVEDGQSHAWFIPLEGASKVVLFSHGNAGNMAGRLESIQLLRSMGFSVFAYDYGGYGRSTGSPSEMRIYADVEAAWHYLTEERGLAPTDIVLFGRSLGGAATAYLASKVTPAAVILESTFTSLPDVVKSMFLGSILSKGIRHHFPSLERVSQIRAPLLIVHSKEDRLIPFVHGKRLFEAAPEPKQFLEIRGDHNTGFVESLPIYTAGWDQFFGTLSE